MTLGDIDVAGEIIDFKFSIIKNTDFIRRSFKAQCRNNEIAFTRSNE